MHVAVYLPLLCSALLGVLAVPAGRHLPPAAGTRVLFLASAVCALSTILSLAALAATVLGQLPLLAAVGGWSADLLHRTNPVPSIVGNLALIALGAFVVLFVIALVRGLSATVRVWRLVRAHPQRLIVLDDAHPDAYALPGRGGGLVVVTTSMLRTLIAAERRVLFAHEAAHLRHRHHLYRAAANLLAALDPLLGTLPRAVRHLTERWADQDAANTVGDRRLVADAVGRAALARHAGSSAHPRKADAGDAETLGRLQALLAPHRWLGRVALLTVAAVLASTVAAIADTSEDAGALFGSAGGSAASQHSDSAARRAHPETVEQATRNHGLTTTGTHRQHKGDHDERDDDD